jgi:hypothetical protein
VLATAKGAAVEQKAKVTAAGDTALITLETLIGKGEGQLDVSPAGDTKDDLKFTLRDGSVITVSLHGIVKVKDLIDRINTAEGNDGKLVAAFDEAKQQLQFTDTTSADAGTSASTSVTQTGSPVFYRRDGGTAVSAPLGESETLNFALRVGTENERFFVTVEGKDYNTGSGDATTWKAQWLVDIKAAIRRPWWRPVSSRPPTRPLWM